MIRRLLRRLLRRPLTPDEARAQAKAMGLWVTMVNPHRGIIHDIPLGDDIPHELDPGCVCGPEAELVQDEIDVWVYRHMPLDGREVA